MSQSLSSILLRVASCSNSSNKTKFVHGELLTYYEVYPSLCTLKRILACILGLRAKPINTTLGLTESVTLIYCSGTEFVLKQVKESQRII